LLIASLAVGSKARLLRAQRTLTFVSVEVSFERAFINNITPLFSVIVFAHVSVFHFPQSVNRIKSNRIESNRVGSIRGELEGEGKMTNDLWPSLKRAMLCILALLRRSN